MTRKRLQKYYRKIEGWGGLTKDRGAGMEGSNIEVSENNVSVNLTKFLAFDDKRNRNNSVTNKKGIKSTRGGID